MRAVPTLINESVSTKVLLRPIRSPIWAKITPPRGRMKNGSANERYANSSEIKGSEAGKKSLLNTNAAAEPYKKKSNHSIALPTRLANRTLSIGPRGIMLGSPRTHSAGTVFRNANEQIALSYPRLIWL